MKKILMTVFLISAAALGKANAQTPAIMVSDKQGWHEIAEKTVDFQKESDEIIVMGADRFASIKFKVEDAPIYLTSLEIFYESGDNQKVDVNMPIQLKGESRVIDLNGGERNLKKIVFVYRTLPNRKDKKAEIEIYGLKTNTDKK